MERIFYERRACESADDSPMEANLGLHLKKKKKNRRKAKFRK